MAGTFAFTAINVLMNQTAVNAGVVNGIAYSCAALVRSTAPASESILLMAIKKKKKKKKKD